ncbi:hypothetical protein [Halovenus salina]|uniref:Uncharacterized protein n=1 Tax=Halovenus salina TaxID=1510225 RepID=A0ABD5W6N4_9EURY|nr:hypothetical protein [Halovenus salina]
MRAVATTRTHLSQFAEAVVYPFETWRGTVGLLLAGALTYVLLILSTMPTFASQMLADGLHWLDYVLVSLTETVYRTDGATGLAVILAYALLTGVAVVNAVARLHTVGPASMADLSGVLPAFLASGCASCGAGLLGVLGFAGGVAALPYDGALVRAAGLALLVVFLARAGHPERCTVEGVAE